jgi:hypothetical protein
MPYFIRSLGTIAFLELLSLVVSMGIGHANPRQADKKVTKSAFRKIYDEDQQNRNDVEGDARRRTQIRQLIADDKVQTGEDYYYAAFIFQHGQKPDDYLYAHVLAMTALEKGFAPARWLSAASLDRYLRSVKQPQIFGTQFGSLFDDRDDQDPYNKELLSDKMREMFCVAPYAKQLKILEDTRSGKEFTSTRTCPIPD